MVHVTQPSTDPPLLEQWDWPRAVTASPSVAGPSEGFKGF